MDGVQALDASWPAEESDVKIYAIRLNQLEDSHISRLKLHTLMSVAVSSQGVEFDLIHKVLFG